MRKESRMGSLLRHVTFKTAILGFTALFIAGVIFIYYPSEKSDQKASLSRVSADEKQGDGLLQAPAALETGQIAAPQQVAGQPNSPAKMAGNVTWEDIKKEAMSNVKLELTKGFLEFDGLKIYRREVTPPSKPKGMLLFLHGMKFKSQTWFDLGTLHIMAGHGYRAVAIDLPGYGESPKADVASVDFMMKILKALDMEQPIICSPSMSGMYAIPLLKEHAEMFKGYIPVAPVGTEKLSEEEYAKTTVPTLIVYGETDTGLGRSSLAHLQNMPNKEIHMLKEAGHAAYLNKPAEFHELLKNFCDKLFK